jgi:signal peptidase
MFRFLWSVILGAVKAAIATATALSIVGLLVLGFGPRTGRFQVMAVLTGSMRPVAPRGSLAVVAPKPLGELRVGDVLTYSIPVEDHHVITHRVVDLIDVGGGRRDVRTKGDANSAPDPWTAELRDPQVWTERFAIPHGGDALALLRGGVGHRVGQAAPFLVAALAILRIWASPATEHTEPREAPA